MNIETSTDILTRSCRCLPEAKTCGLTHTRIHEALQTGKPQDTKIGYNNNFPDKATSTVRLQCLPHTK